MFIFTANFFLTAFFWLITNTQRKNKDMQKTLTVFFMSIIAINLILLLALRSTSVGIDTLSYRLRFNLFRQANWSFIQSNSQEKGFSLLIRAIGSYTDNFQWFLFVCAVLSIVPVMVVITKYSKLPFLSVMLFLSFEFYSFLFSGIRQGLAVSLCFGAYHFLRKKQIIPYLLLVLVAVQFHKTAYIFLPAYLVNFIKPGKYSYLFFGILYLAVALFKSPMYNYFQQTFYSHQHYELSQTTAFIWPLILTLIGVVTLVFSEEIIKKDPRDITVVFLICIAVVLSQFTLLGSNAKRAASFYSIFLILAIPCIIEAIENPKIKKTVFWTMCIGTCAMFVFSVASDMYNLIPYTTFFQ